MSRIITIIIMAVTGLLSACGPSIPVDMGAFLIPTKGPSIFKLERPSNWKSGGTGFSLKMPSGRILTVTNSHVCYIAENGRLRAEYNDGNAEYLGVIAISDESDLCLMEGSKFAPPLKMAEFDYLYGRHNVLGFPLLNPLTYTYGYIVARESISIPLELEKERCIGAKFDIKNVQTFFGPAEMCVMTVDAYDSSITTFPGNSGSPVMNDNGDVVGVIFAGSNMTHWGMFVPMDVLKHFIELY